MEGAAEDSRLRSQRFGNRQMHGMIQSAKKLSRSESTGTRADDKERDDLLYYITDRAEQIDITERRPVEEFRSLEDQDSDVSSQKASDFVRLATGKATPVLTYEDRWLAISGYDPSRGSCDT